MLARRAEILFVADLLHPLDHLAVESLLERDVRHGRVGRGAVPVAAAGLAPDDVAGADLLAWLAVALVPAGAGGDDQGLAERMAVPRAARAGREADQGAGEAGGVAPGELPFDRDVAGEIGVWAFLRGLRAVADDGHRGVAFPPSERVRGGLVA